MIDITFECSQLRSWRIVILSKIDLNCVDTTRSPPSLMMRYCHDAGGKVTDACFFQIVSSVCFGEYVYTRVPFKKQLWNSLIPGLEGIVPDDALLLFWHVLPRGRVSQVHQGFSVEKAEAETAVDHQPSSVPLPAGVIGQRVELWGPHHNVLQVSPVKIWAEGWTEERTQKPTSEYFYESAEFHMQDAERAHSILLFQRKGKYSSSQGGGGRRSRVSLSAFIVQIGTRLKVWHNSSIKITSNDIW